MRRLAARLMWVAGALLLLAPSAWFAIRYSSVPQFGAFHDDVVYWTSAHSLARGDGYQIPYLAEHPAQTKYPPLYPAVLSVAWWLNGSFPGNLETALALHWLFFPLWVWLVWLLLRRFEFSKRVCYGLTFMAAAAPMTVIFSTALMTEIPFTATVLAALLLLDERRDPAPVRAFGSGLCTAAAFLIRTNGIALAVGVAALLLLNRRWKPAASFLTPVLAAVTGWQLWRRANAIPAHDDRTAYYTTYVDFFIHTFSWPEAPLRVWVNVSTLMDSLGKLLLFQIEPTVLVRCLLWVIAFATLSGVVELCRRGFRHYGAFALVFLGLLAVWPYPPGERFVYPLLPLLLAGLAVRLEIIGGAIQAAWKRAGAGDRPVAVVATVCAMALLAACGGATAVGLTRDLPRFFDDCEVQRARMIPAYSWIRSHTAPDARLAAYDDGLLYLVAGRHGYTAPIMPARFYSADPASTREYVEQLPVLWRSDHVTHILVTSYDFRRDLHEPAASALRRLVADPSCFRLEYADATAQVYRFLDPCSERQNLLTNRIERQAALLHVRDVP